MEPPKRLVMACLALAIILTGCSLASSTVELTEDGPVPYTGTSVTSEPILSGVEPQAVDVEDRAAPDADVEDRAAPDAAIAIAPETSEAAETTPAASADLAIEEPAEEDNSATAAVTFEPPSAWAVPVDANRILNRIIMTGRWAGRQEPHSRPGVEAGGVGSCRLRTLVPLPDAWTVTTRGWGGGIDAMFSVAIFDLGDPTTAKEYVAATVAATAGGNNDCLPVEVGAAVQEFELSDYGLETSQYMGQRITYDGNDRVTEIVFTTHDRLAIVVQMHTAVDPTPYDQGGWQELLDKLDLSLASPPMLQSTGSPLMSADEFEAMMVGSFRERAFGYSTADYECILRENLDNLETTGDRLPGAVLSYVVRWCAPHVMAAQAASAEFPFNIRIDDADKRLCYATVLAEAYLRPTFRQMIEERDQDRGPYSEDRAAIDARLLKECGVTADEGVIAGLDPREPLDDSPEGAAFCAGWKEGLGIGSTSDLEEIEGLVTRYRATVAQVERLVPPASIAAEWEVRGAYFQEKARVHEEEQIGEVAIYTHDEFVAFQTDIGYRVAWDTIKEYLRINCGVNIGKVY